jgi:peptidoglycan glycosyltransferase
MDLPLQTAAYNALLANRGMAGPGDGAAMAVVDVGTGQVIAAASIPAPMSGSQPGSGLDRSIDGHYPPGSTFKIVTAAAGLADGLDGYTVNCNHTASNLIWKYKGSTYSRRSVTDEDGFPPHGLVGMDSALTVSCNVYFSQLGLRIGAPDLSRTATEDFGLRLMPGADEMAPDLADSGYGQGKDLVTPLEMAMVAQTIANDGHRLKPQFQFDALTDDAKGIPASHANAIGAMMLHVTQQGTARGVFDSLGVSVAGKTGSAQTRTEGPQTHSWFVGYAPADHPKLAFACVVEHGGSGRGAAAPACRDMLKAALDNGLLR